MSFNTQQVPKSAPVQSMGPAHAYFSAWNLNAYYGESYIVQGVSFDVREGEILALLGRNGAGKSTLVQSLLGFRNPQEGHLTVQLKVPP